MKFKTSLIPGKILNRYKRFLADVELQSGEIITAHIANTGSMKTCWAPGWNVLLSHHDNPKRKLKYSLELIHNSETWICVNTSLPNKIAIEAINHGLISELSGYSNLKPEAKIGKSRIDILLSDEEKGSCYVEVKNVTLKGNEKTFLFPDAISTRAQKHLQELIQLKEEGTRAVMLFIINREDGEIFSPADHIDPTYGNLLREALKKGVEILPYQCKLSPEEVKVTKSIPFKL